MFLNADDYPQNKRQTEESSIKMDTNHFIFAYASPTQLETYRSAISYTTIAVIYTYVLPWYKIMSINE